MAAILLFLLVVFGNYLFQYFSFSSPVSFEKNDFLYQDTNSLYTQDIKYVPLNVASESKKILTITSENKEKTLQNLGPIISQKNSVPVLEWNVWLSIAKNKKLPVSVILKSINTLQDKYAEAELPAGVYVKTQNNLSYEKEIQKPKFVDPKQYNIDNKQAVAMIDVWSDLESIFFKDEQGNPEKIIIRMPAPWYEIWSKANVYSSEDGEDWKFHALAVVQSIENAPYVEFSTTHFTLFAVGAIQWDNDNFLTEEFWDNNPTDAQIIRALYGDGSGWIERTSYTKYWSEVWCVTGNMSVTYLSGGIWTIPLTLSANTVYVLESGDYITTWSIEFNSCSAVIGKTGTVNLYSSVQLSSSNKWLFHITNKKYSIIDYLNIDGINTWTGSIHSANIYGITYYYWAINHTTNNVHVYNTNSAWILLNWGTSLNVNKYIILNNCKLYNNSYWLYLWSYNYNSVFTNIESYNNSYYAISINSSSNNNLFSGVKLYNNSTNWLRITASDYNEFFGLDVYWNTNIWIYLNDSLYNQLESVKTYNNGQEWLLVSNSSHNTKLKNISSYNNKSYWINITSSSNVSLDTIQTYNNTYEWITVNVSPYVVLNNIQSYNNVRQGVNIQWNSTYFSLNNIVSYNNWNNGLNINSTNTWVVKNVYLYNNFLAWLESYNSSNILLYNISLFNNQKWLYFRWTSTWYVYYWNMKLYDNSLDFDLISWSLMRWISHSLWFSWGYVDSLPCFRCWDVVNPTSSLSWFLMNTWLYRSCNFRWNESSWQASSLETVQYQYWTRIPKQGQAVIYSWSQLVFSDLPYSWDLYIGEVNKIGENLDTSCNNCWWAYSVSWDNDDFIDENFWNQNPNSCDIVAALYGTWLNKIDPTSYTKDWILGTNTPFCSIENMQVVSFNPGIDILPTYLSSYTIYVLSWWNYILSWNSSVHLGNCSSIIVRNTTWYFYSTWKIDQIFFAKNKSNIILQWLDIHWSGNWFWWFHVKNSYWILLDWDSKNNSNTLFRNISTHDNSYWIFAQRTFHNNVFNNIVTYNNSDWIQINNSNNNFFYNVNSFSNTQGLYLASSNNNTFDWLSIYKNTSHWIRLSSSNNVISNSKIYENNSYWIYLDTNSNFNYLKNIFVYNNTGVWIYSYSASSNIFEKSKIYNNGKWIEVSRNSNKNHFNNLSIFNNKTNWLEFNSSTPTNNSLSNLQIFNNQIGLYFYSYWSWNLVFNTQIFNNSSYWISLWSAQLVKNNIFTNVSVFNNGIWLYNISNISWNYVYWFFNVFWNSSDITWSLESFIIWNNEYSYLWWNWWTILTWISLWFANISNPKNILDQYLFSWTWTFESIRWYKLFNIGWIQTSYWSNIPRQTQPVIWSWNQLVLSWSYDSNKYIGWDDFALTWILSWFNPTWHSSLLNLSYISNSWFQYNLFGDVYVSSSWVVNTPISLILSQWTGTKTLIGQLFDGNSFTHFVYTSDYLELPYVDLFDSDNQQIIENELLNWWYRESLWSIKGIQEWYFIGNKDVRLYHSNWELSVPLIMQSTWSSLAEVQLLSWTIIVTENNQPYTGIVSLPSFKNPLESSLSWTLAVVSFWNKTFSLQLKDADHNPLSAIIRIPVLAEIGEHMDVYYSEDNWNTWQFHTGATIVSLSGLSYVEFQTTHFTDFAIVGVGELPPESLTWSFVINNDSEYTLTWNVTLTLDASWATDVRFQNEGGAWSEWFGYTWTYQWMLTWEYGIKIVYVEIDFDSDWSWEIVTSDSIIYSQYLPWQQWWNITLEITWWVSECAYGTSLSMNAQDVQIGVPYNFTWIFPFPWYCQDYKGFDSGWSLTIQTSDLFNEKGNVISGNNLFISHDPVIVQWDVACTGYSWLPTEFYTMPYPIFAKSSGSNKICKITASNITLSIVVPANQSPGKYVGVLTLYIPNF